MIENTLLLVVDVQNGFVTNNETKAIIPLINKLTVQWQEAAQPVVFSKFINRPGSAWCRFIGWDKLQAAPETSFYSAMNTSYGEVYEKTTYSSWSAELEQICRDKQITTVAICGIDTDQCVLATAVTIFDTGLRPLILTDCCASSAGEDYHQDALKLLDRLVGHDQLVDSSFYMDGTK